MHSRLARPLLALILALAGGFAAAQTFPTRPVTLVVPFATGGSTPAQAAKLVDDEIQRWAAVIKAANIKAD